MVIEETCTYTSLVIAPANPFADKSYLVLDPQSSVNWGSDAALATTALHPNPCGTLTIKFWLMDATGVTQV